jgi:nicotinamidase-related amidase
MMIERLDPQHSALVLFDFLNGHVNKEDVQTRERYRPVIAAAGVLLAAARAAGMMVAYACAHHRSDGRTQAATLQRLRLSRCESNHCLSDARGLAATERSTRNLVRVSARRRKNVDVLSYGTVFLADE